MIPVIVAGFAFGVGAAIGQEVAERYVIPASKKFFNEAKEEWSSFSAIWANEWERCVRESEKEMNSDA